MTKKHLTLGKYKEFLNLKRDAVNNDKETQKKLAAFDNEYHDEMAKFKEVMDKLNLGLSSFPKLPTFDYSPPLSTFLRSPEEVQNEAILEELIKIRQLQERQQTQVVETPISPQISEQPKPAKDAGFDAWFDYYYYCRSIRRKYTLRELAKDMGFSLSYIKAQHRLYKQDKDL